MPLTVIGAGFGRTGTYSLKLALEALGHGPCYHMFELARHRRALEQWEAALNGRTPDWDEIFTGYQSTVDFPGCIYYRELLEHYPQARVIMTWRDPDAWYASAYQTILTIRPSILQVLKIALCYPVSREARSVLRLALHNKKLIEDQLFGGRVHDAQHVIDVYQRHSETVRESVPSDRLLVYQVSEGWGPLCDFLNQPVPDTPFPRTNDEKGFTDTTRELFFSF